MKRNLIIVLILTFLIARIVTAQTSVTSVINIFSEI